MNINCCLASIYASLPRTTRGQPIVLGADPKGKTILYTNGNSVFIRNLEVSENDLNQDKKRNY